MGWPLGGDLKGFDCISSTTEESKSERLDEGSKLQGSRSWRDLSGDIKEFSKDFIHVRRLRALRKFYDSLYIFYFFWIGLLFSNNEALIFMVFRHK